MKILSAMLAEMRHQALAASRQPRNRCYPTHTFMRPRRRKFKGWMRAATR